MKYTILLSFGSLLLLFGCGQQQVKAPKGIEHVVVIGLDGMSTQGFREANTPCMDSLMRNGAYSYEMRCIIPSVSKPNWNAMLCGAGPDITGVTGNGWYRDQFDLQPVVMTSNHSFPNIFWIIREQRPDAELGSIYHWGDFGSTLDEQVMNMSKTYPSAWETARKTAEYILDKKPDFLFIQLDDVDHFGHADGHMSEGYIRGIEEADQQVKTIVDAISDAGIAGSTMIMIVSDHGGVYHGHGGNTYEEMTTPVIFCGKGIKKGYEIQQQIYRYDVAADVAFALGITPPQVWVGRPTLPAYEGFTEPANLWKGIRPLPAPFFATETYDRPDGGKSTGGKPLTVNMKAPVGIEGEIRYTTDGTDPTRSSLLYTAPFSVDTTTTITARFFTADGESLKATARYEIGK
ncbi:MAG: alkaline phosphatase family protein [Tannerella sp.]|jgi:hypothetical protein|nr:alkaline phosphatase family protein [Tannerella sp.]